MVYISWSFLKMGDKADGKTGLVLLLISLIPLALVTFFAFILGVGMLLYAWPVLLPMLLPFYLPFALRKEAVQEIHSRNILFGRDPLAVTYRTVVRNWVYAVYAVLPALPLPFLGWKMPLDGSGNGRAWRNFSCSGRPCTLLSCSSPSSWGRRAACNRCGCCWPPAPTWRWCCSIPCAARRTGANGSKKERLKPLLFPEVL